MALLRNVPKPRMKLTFIPSETVEGKLVVKYKVTDILPGINRWKAVAYGYVMGILPTIGAIEGFAQANWAKFGFEDVHKLSSGLFTFRFKSEVERDQMLNKGPWIFVRKRLIIKAWSPDAKIEHKGEEKVPIWVKITNLSLQFWNEEMLSKIGSYIGVPLIANSATSTMERMSYARVYVEVRADHELPDFVPLVNNFGDEFRQKVVYDWIPPKYSHCKLFRHDDKWCEYGGASLVDKQGEIVVDDPKVRRE
ncbi:hypothetical protein LIER_36639 [Lithospermum erythrorhizon]|uniref:DUF4283 domain-containing protein n=1 Tax=Lithospermum erythrorhizon TaxID=34254 RepID=A0AAV3P8N3_LITER